MPVHHVVRQAQGHTQFTYLVFEQFTQWLQQFQAQLLRQSTHVVMALDHHRFFGLGST